MISMEFSCKQRKVVSSSNIETNIRKNRFLEDFKSCNVYQHVCMLPLSTVSQWKQTAGNVYCASCVLVRVPNTNKLGNHL